MRVEPLPPVGLRCAQHRLRSVENGAAFSTWRSGAKRALTPTLSQWERGLFEQAFVASVKGRFAPLSSRHPLARNHPLSQGERGLFEQAFVASAKGRFSPLSPGHPLARNHPLSLRERAGVRVKPLQPVGLRCAQHRLRSVENGAAFSTWRSGARRALTPPLSRGERGLLEQAFVFSAKGGFAPLSPGHPLARNHPSPGEGRPGTDRDHGPLLRIRKHL